MNENNDEQFRAQNGSRKPFLFSGQGRGRGRRGKHRGRPPVSYPVQLQHEVKESLGILELTSFEIQILKLADIKSLTQQEIAETLKISQTSVWRYLKAIRARIAQTLISYKSVEIRVIDTSSE